MRERQTDRQTDRERERERELTIFPDVNRWVECKPPLGGGDEHGPIGFFGIVQSLPTPTYKTIMHMNVRVCVRMCTDI